MAHLSEPIELDLTDEQAFIVSVFIREGELRECERIIALLEAERCGYLSCPDEDCHNCEMPINEVIALIKGDTE